MNIGVFISALGSASGEFIEIAAIADAIALSGSPREASLGVIAGLSVVSMAAIGLGTQLQAIPLELLQIVIDLLLLWFCFGWVKKSIWRQVEGKRAGWISEPLTSEEIVLETENTGFNFLNFILMTKSAALEALEIAIIVVTLGFASSAWNESRSGAALALLLTTAIVTLLHGQLLQVSENLIKLSAGIVLMAFGTFWIGEGLDFK